MTLPDEEGPWYDNPANWEDCARVALDVPYKQKDDFRREFPEAKWDADGKYWYLPVEVASDMHKGAIPGRWGRVVTYNPRKMPIATNS